MRRPARRTPLRPVTIIRLLPSDMTLRVKSLESLLVEKGLVDPAALDALVDTFENKVGPRNGARVVAKAWVDPAYKRRLLADADAAIAEFGYTGQQGEHMVVLENTPTVHHMVVCTLCSCYPWPTLGLPPVWYKSAPYRSRAVIDPRGVLQEFGVTIPDDVEVRVWDATAEIRYLVLPERPAGTEGMSEEALAALVTRRLDDRRRQSDAWEGDPMNGLHDMGGMQGFGPIQREANEPVFHAPWEGRVITMVMGIAAWGKFGVDQRRYARELIPPAEFLRMSYYELWYTGLITTLLDAGMVTRAEIDSGVPAAGSAKLTPALLAARVPTFFANGTPKYAQCARRSQFPRRPARARQEHQSDDAHAASPLRARANRCCHARLRRLCVSGHQRHRPGREAAAPLFGALRSARIVGRAGEAQGQRLYRHVGRLS